MNYSHLIKKDMEKGLVVSFPLKNNKNNSKKRGCDKIEEINEKEEEDEFDEEIKILKKSNKNVIIINGKEENDSRTCQSLPERIVSNINKKKSITINNKINNDDPNKRNKFKTWPDKKKTNTATQKCDNLNENNTKILTLNQALENISLAYSPLTKQLIPFVSVETKESKKIDPIVVKEDDSNFNYLKNGDDVEVRRAENDEDDDDVNILTYNKGNSIKCHRRTNNGGSFSSTISSDLSEPSTSGSLLDYEDRELIKDDFKIKNNNKSSLADFLSKQVFKIFTRQNQQQSPVHVVASSSALIQHERPSNLPAKTWEESKKHRDEYKAILAAAKKRDAEKNASKQKKEKIQLKMEERQAATAKHFSNHVIPNWDFMRTNKKTMDLWWHGLPSSVRGKVWLLAIGNELKLTRELYDICLERARNKIDKCGGGGETRKKIIKSPTWKMEENKDKKMEAMELWKMDEIESIKLDISRTFPNLCIFQKGGPWSDNLHNLLAAYVCYRPDVGYCQGMSYIAAILILNMEQYEAFLCFSNLINRRLHLIFFTLNQDGMKAYFDGFNMIFKQNLPDLYQHFHHLGLTADLYLLDWICTIFAKAMPLDVACRVWDVFLRDGYEFIFKSAIGVLRLNRDVLLDMDFVRCAQFLCKLPEDMSSDALFKSIERVKMGTGKCTFGDVVEKSFSEGSCVVD